MTCLPDLKSVKMMLCKKPLTDDAYLHKISAIGVMPKNGQRHNEYDVILGGLRHAG